MKGESGLIQSVVHKIVAVVVVVVGLVVVVVLNVDIEFIDAQETMCRFHLPKVIF